MPHRKQVRRHTCQPIHQYGHSAVYIAARKLVQVQQDSLSSIVSVNTLTVLSESSDPSKVVGLFLRFLFLQSLEMQIKRRSGLSGMVAGMRWNWGRERKSACTRKMANISWQGKRWKVQKPGLSKPSRGRIRDARGFSFTFILSDPSQCSRSFSFSYFNRKITIFN